MAGRTMIGSTCGAFHFFLPPLGFGWLSENRAIIGRLLEHTIRYDKSLCVALPRIRVACVIGFFSR